MFQTQRISAVVLFCATTLLATTAWSAEPAPAFKLPTAKGMVELGNLKGKVVYLDFWASWCTPCRKAFPFMNELNKKYKDQGLEIIAVNLDKSRAPIDEFLAKTPAEFTIAYDPSGTTATAYKVQGMPSTYIISRTGMLEVTHIGFRDKDKEKMENKIKELLGNN